VAVCPTGIDIRNGLQMECIGCAQCIDACDEIMDKVKRPRGLIRYDSRRGFDEGVRRSLARPRVMVYAVLAVAGIVVAGFNFAGRTEFEARALRPRGLPYQIDGDEIRNVFTLRIQNKTGEDRTYVVSVPETTMAIDVIVAQSTVTIPGLSDHQVPIVLHVARTDYVAGFPLAFEVTDQATGRTKTVNARFRGP
jgi:polyferredoxin